MTASVDGWVRACSLSDIPSNGMLRIETEGRPAVVLINAAGKVSALRDRCSHGEFPLSEGYLEGDRVECPLHGAYFCVHSGRNLTPPATEPVKTFPTSVKDGDVWIDYRTL